VAEGGGLLSRVPMYGSVFSRIKTSANRRIYLAHCGGASGIIHARPPQSVDNFVDNFWDC
jgi:hypothetical protein